MSVVAPELLVREPDHEQAIAPPAVLAAELDFYQTYAWCLNPHLTVREAIGRLHEEIDKLAVVPAGWQIGEVAINIFLLAGGLLNCVDEHLRGPGLRLPWKLAATRLGRTARWGTENVLGRLRVRPSRQVRRFREGWLAGLTDFLALVVAGQTDDRRPFVEAGARLAKLLESPLPRRLAADRVGVPSPFRRLDLTHHDVIALAQSYMKRFPDRSQPILLVGLRTSGSYFAPLLRACFEAAGYGTVPLVTLVPGKGPGRQEAAQLRRYARQGYTALIVDDSPHSGGTIFTAFEIARRAGFDRDKLKAVVPAHPAKRNWFKPLPDDFVVSLAPEQWHKRALLDPSTVQARLADYFRSRNFVRVTVVASDRAEDLNARLQAASIDERGSRLKRIFEVHLETAHGGKEIRYVLTKSVGWGWLGYHAFLAGHRLEGFVPPILGLRDGILYMEWIAQSPVGLASEDQRDARIDACALYVAERARHLNLEAASLAHFDPGRQENGNRLLSKALSRAHGPFVTDVLNQPRLARRLRQQPCPVPSLIDGNMRRSEWIVGPHGLVKTDYEHHGLGKEELNVIDPAYDLADSILDLELLPEEESVLLRRYRDASGDFGVDQRLFMNKLLAGLWAMKRAQEHMFGKTCTADRQQEFHRRFMLAWNFLTVEAARKCGSYMAPTTPHWGGPLVMLDIDGVIDRRVFGFPCTTAAGIEALSLLSTHGLSVAVNTARSVAEVEAYCDAYALSGGVAEHGGFMWDAVNRRGQVLISPEAERQLDKLRRSLQRIPGVFLDDRHRYSIRAFTYQPKPSGVVSALVRSIRACSVGDGAVAPVSTLLMQHLLADLGLDRLSFHHTMIDTTIVAREVDKGTGLSALRDWVLPSGVETIAVGDQEADLAMFRAATRSFAPANISCGRQARLLGCRIVGNAYQRGLREIAGLLIHPDGRGCESCVASDTLLAEGDLFMEVLRIADRKWSANMVRSMFNRDILKILAG